MNKALVIIDVQNYYIKGHIQDLAAKIATYLDEHTKEYDHVLFTKYVNNDDTALSKFRNWRKMQSSPDIDMHDALKGYIKPNNLFEKSTFSALKSESFVSYLENNRIEELILCGIDTDCCILATLFDAFDQGYKVNIIV